MDDGLDLVLGEMERDWVAVEGFDWVSGRGMGWIEDRLGLRKMMMVVVLCDWVNEFVLGLESGRRLGEG